MLLAPRIFTNPRFFIENITFIKDNSDKFKKKQKNVIARKASQSSCVSNTFKDRFRTRQLSKIKTNIGFLHNQMFSFASYGNVDMFQNLFLNAKQNIL